MKKIIVAGTGFSGVWAALSACRAIALANQQDEFDVTVVSPEPNLVIRPRLYEAQLDDMAPDVSALLKAAGARHLPGRVITINTAARTVVIELMNGAREMFDYDRFVLATGSQLFRPQIPGLEEYAFDVDQLASARELDIHLEELSRKPDSAARNTVLVAGGGLTGIEAAMEMPIRLRSAWGPTTKFDVVLVDTADRPGGALGEAAQPFISEALNYAGVAVRTGSRVNAITVDSATLSSGERIATNTVVWTAGMRASPLAAQIPGERDELGRIVGDAYLRAPSANGIFVTGDTVRARTDDLGHSAVMSCQHALSLGRVAGHNAAAELIGLPLHAYSQPKYVTCIDLGAWGALYTEGWDRKVRFTRQEAKKIKQEINRVWIYPPTADREAVFAVANPDYVIVP